MLERIGCSGTPNRREAAASIKGSEQGWSRELLQMAQAEESAMDRAVRRPLDKQKSVFSNHGEVSFADQPLLETPQGPQPGTDNENPSVADEEIAEKSVGSRPHSDVTAFHDPSGDEE